MTNEQFSKKWENFWYYHKFHTIAAVIAIIIVAVTVTQCASIVSPDMTVMIVSKSVYMSQDQINSVQNMLQKYTADVNHDGKKKVNCEFFNLDPSQDSQIVGALQEKLIANLSLNSTVLFVTDNSYYSQLNKQGEFEKISVAIPGAPDKLRIPLSSLPDFKSTGISGNVSKLYLSVCKYTSSQPKKEANNSINILKKLLENGGLF